MNIHIAKNGSQLGPFDEATVRSMLQSGMISAGNLYWIEGQTTWEPLSALFPDLAVPQVAISPVIQLTSAIPVSSPKSGILIARNGSQIGPFDEATVRTMIQSSMASAGDLYWIDGMTSWEPLSALSPVVSIKQSSPSIPSPPQPQPAPAESDDQKTSNNVVLVGYVFALLSLAVYPLFFGLIGMALGVIAITRGKKNHGVAIVALCFVLGVLWSTLG